MIMNERQLKPNMLERKCDPVVHVHVLEKQRFTLYFPGNLSAVKTNNMYDFSQPKVFFFMTEQLTNRYISTKY